MNHSMHWSKGIHDFLAAAATGGAVGLTFTTVEMSLKILVMVLTSIFITQGICMRHLKRKNERTSETEEEGED